jgi:hypothetical protein
LLKISPTTDNVIPEMRSIVGDLIQFSKYSNLVSLKPQQLYEIPACAGMTLFVIGTVTPEMCSTVGNQPCHPVNAPHRL